MNQPTPTSIETQLPPILFQDEEIMVMNKPAGLIVQQSHTHALHTLEEMLEDRPELERRGIVHRLDKDTSGLMVIARTAKSQQSLQQQFKDRSVDKEYIALVWDKFPPEHAMIDAPIARHPVQGHKYVVMEGGREAKTEIWRQQVYQLPHQLVSLLKIKLHTGRTHQIRVHLSALGFPLVGDPVYGRRKDPRTIRLFLHASHLGFVHPATAEPLSFDAPLAEDLQTYLDSLIIETSEK